MNSLFRFDWLAWFSVGLCALLACSSNDAKTGAPSGSVGGSPPIGGANGTGGSGGSGEPGGMGGDGDDSGGAGAVAGAGASAGAGAGGVPDGAGTGGEGGSWVDPVSVTSAQLPEATLNQDYRFVFEASGGTGEGYAFGLDGLPRGLALEEDGTLSGIPLEGGDFELELVVTDSNGATARATLRLHVRQSRWLAYWNVLAGNVTVPRYSAIDLASEGFVRRDLSGSLPPNQNGPDATQRGFSPDGRFGVYAVFIYGEHVGNEYRLVDFDRLADFDWDDENAEPSIVANNFGTELVQMYGGEWTPDSKRLAVLTLVENAAHELQSPGRLGWFEVDEVLATPNESTNLRRRPEGASTNLVDWVSPGAVVFLSQGLDEYENPVAGNLVKVTWQGDEPGAPETLLGSTGEPYGESDYVHYVNRATETAVIARSSNPHCIPSIELYRFASNEAVNLGETPLLPSPALDRFAGVLESTLKIVDAESQVLATLGPSDCNLVEWSQDGSLLGWVDTTNKNYQVGRIGPNGQAMPSVVPASTYTTSADRPTFSSNGRWVAYRADNALFVARIDEMGIQNAVRINVDLVAPGDRVGSYQFAPNGRALVYAAAGQIAGLDDLYLVDLSGETPGSSRRISPDLSGFPSADALVIPPPDSDADAWLESRWPLWEVWTPDSSKVFFVVHDSGGQVGDVLYVVDVLAAQPTSVRVDVGNCDSYACGSIHPVRAQPLR